MFHFYFLFDESIKIIKIVKLGLCKSVYFVQLKPYLLSVTIIENIFLIYVFVSNLVFILLHYNSNVKIIVNNLLSFFT